MATVTRDFKICDRCQTEVQVYELDDEGNMSDALWTTLVISDSDHRGKTYHFCPKCTRLFEQFRMVL